MRKLSALGMSVVVAASLLMPLTTFAYLTPDQVFGGSDTSVPPPPTQREGDAVVRAQQQQAAAQRQAAQQQLVPVDAAPVDTYVPPVTASSKGLFDQNAQYQLRQERIADEKSDAPTIVIGDSVLHSGAPYVSTTGPASMLAALAMMLAALCTFSFAQIRSRKGMVTV